MHDTHEFTALDLNLLRALAALLDTGSVTRAAALAGITQPAMSRALGRLRGLLGDALLVRAGRGMVLTPRGEQLRPQVGRVLADVVHLLSAPGAFDPAGSRRVFRMAAADFFTTVAVPRWLAHVRGVAPQVGLEVVQGTHAALELESGALDVVVAPPRQVEGGEFRRTRLMEESFEVLLRPDHPALGAPWTVEVWAAQPHLLVAPGGRPGGLVDDLLAARGLHRRTAVLVQSFAAAPPIVAASDLVVTLPARLARRVAPRWGLATRPVPLEGLHFALDLFWHARLDADPAHRWFRGTWQALRPFPA
jgi:DNA-binding transcriptional LysR family regulator